VRWFIAFLIVANVILFFWAKQQSRPAPDSSTLPPPDIGRLRLLTELEKAPETASAVVQGTPVDVEPAGMQATEPLSPEVATPISGPEAMPETDGNGEEAVSSPVPLPVQESELPAIPPEPPAEPVVANAAPALPQPEVTLPEDIVAEPTASEEVTPPEIALTERPDDELPETTVVDFDGAGSQEVAVSEGGSPATAEQMEEAAAPEPQPQPPPASNDVEQVAAESSRGRTPDVEDASADASADTGEAVESPAADPEVAAPEPLCARAGPFEPDDADRLIAGLPGHIELLSDVSEEYTRVDRYYVLIPALPSRAEGRNKLRELADAGFTDTWLFPSGEYRNAISMGYFSREARARRHAADIVKKGFETEVREKASLRQRRWLLLKRADADGKDFELPLPKGAGIEPQACP